MWQAVTSQVGDVGTDLHGRGGVGVGRGLPGRRVAPARGREGGQSCGRRGGNVTAEVLMGRI